MDTDGEEGIPAFTGFDGTHIPLIAADQLRVESLRPIAAQMAKELGKPLKLVRFDNRTEMETINP